MKTFLIIYAIIAFAYFIYIQYVASKTAIDINNLFKRNVCEISTFKNLKRAMFFPIEWLTIVIVIIAAFSSGRKR